MEVSQIFKLILLFGGVVSILMAVLLWFYVENFSANRVLAVLTFVWGITVFAFVIQSKAFFFKYPHLFGLFTSLNLLFFPLVFIYVKTFLNREARNYRTIIIHFIPFLIYLIAIAPFVLNSAETKIEIFEAGLPSWLKTVLKVTDVIIILQGIFYTVISVRIIHRYQFFRGNRVSHNEQSIISWLKQFVIINVVLWAIGTTSVFLELVITTIPFDLFKLYYLGITILTFWMGILTIKRTQFFTFDTGGKFTLKVNTNHGEQKIKNLQASDEQEKTGEQLILDFMEGEKPYLKSDMTIHDIVEGTGLNKIKVSELINDELRQSFYDFVSGYRTKEVIRLIGEGKIKDYTLIHISEMAGFNSKATFYRAFKKHTGKTPNEYAGLFKI